MFNVAVLVRLRIEHVLSKGSFEFGQRAFCHNKACARNFCRRFEVHHLEGFAHVEMLTRFEIVTGRFAPAAHLDVSMLVKAIGNFIEGDVGNGGK